MPTSRPTRLVAAALRCYPRGWRRRRGDEAAELAALLMRDGVPARSIACSYFLGAARARLAPDARRRLAAMLGSARARVAVGARRRLGGAARMRVAVGGRRRLGAGRARVAVGGRRRLGTVVGALMLAAASLGGPLAFLSATAPAHAATVVVRTHHDQAVRPAGHLRRREPAAPGTAAPGTAAPSLIGSCHDQRC